MPFLLGSAGFSDTSTNTSQNFNQNTNTTGNTTASGATTGTASKTLTPYQASLQQPLFSYIQQLMMPGGAQAAVAPFTAASRDATNSTYSGLADMLRQQFMTTGGGQSGKYGTALTQGNLQRLGALQNVDVTGEEQAAALPLTAASLASNLLGLNFGETTSGTQTGTSASTGTSATSGSSTGSSNSMGFGLNFGGGGNL